MEGILVFVLEDTVNVLSGWQKVTLNDISLNFLRHWSKCIEVILVKVFEDGGKRRYPRVCI